jgi:hypothetical protein
VLDVAEPALQVAEPALQVAEPAVHATEPLLYHHQAEHHVLLAPVAADPRDSAEGP